MYLTDFHNPEQSSLKEATPKTAESWKSRVSYATITIIEVVPPGRSYFIALCDLIRKYTKLGQP